MNATGGSMKARKAVPAALDPGQMEKEAGKRAEAEAKTWRRYTCTLVTPMYGGGVKAGEVDKDMPIRATAIRGQLRFWWRLINRSRFVKDGKLDSAALFKAEREIWGGLGDDDDLAASRVILHLDAPRIADGRLGLSTDRIKDKDVGYAFGASANNGEARWLKAGYEWSMRIEGPPTLWPEVEVALRWWSSFGGVGARTRRGFGAVEVAEDTSGKPRFLRPIDKEEAKACGMTLILRDDESGKAEVAWKNGVAALREFRQGAGIGRKTKQEGNTGGTSPGRSYWPEPDAIRRVVQQWFGKSGPARHEVKDRQTKKYEPVGVPHDHAPRHLAGQVFPRAAFGLPIIFHFKDRTDPQPDIQLIPDNGSDRLASPLILRPYRDQSGQWRPAALRLHVGHVWKMGLCFKGRSETFASGSWWPAKEERKGIADKIPPIAKTGYDDPLTAFLRFFKQQEAK
jgi:CRISPR-associated protein Cmr1